MLDKLQELGWKRVFNKLNQIRGFDKMEVYKKKVCRCGLRVAGKLLQTDTILSTIGVYLGLYIVCTDIQISWKLNPKANLLNCFEHMSFNGAVQG